MKQKLDDKKKGEICGILSVGGTFAMAAKRVGCSRQTIYDTINRDPEFKQRVFRAQTRTESIFLKTIARAGKETRYWAAARWALQHMYPDRYARRPLTMNLEDIKGLISQLLNAVAKAVPDAATRAEIRRRVRGLVKESVSRCKKRHQEKPRLAINTIRIDGNPQHPHSYEDV